MESIRASASRYSPLTNNSCTDVYNASEEDATVASLFSLPHATKVPMIAANSMAMGMLFLMGRAISQTNIKTFVHIDKW